MIRLTAIFALCFALLCGGAWAHDIPASRIEVRVSASQVALQVDAPVFGWMYDIPVLTPETATSRQAELEALAAGRVTIAVDGAALPLVSAGRARVLPQTRGQTSLRLLLAAPVTSGAKTLTVRSHLFPTDPKHHTVLIVRGSDGQLLHEAILTPDAPEAVIPLRSAVVQNPLTVFAQFVREGVFHIAIGLDHILFVVALLLMGGGVKQLLKVVTAFTLAHSITLVLAALHFVTVPSFVVEPIIAASIVFVAVRVLQTKWRRDGAKPTEERLPYAFGFGLVHGFGFASALSELELPRESLAVSLFGFNVGVEVGQAALVLVIAPLLAGLHRKYPVVAHRLVLIIAGIVVALGAYWFGERIAG